MNQESYAILIGLGLASLRGILNFFTKSKVPQEILNALEDAVAQVELHFNDVITKNGLEKLRG